jgi:hypothetical protein
MLVNGTVFMLGGWSAAATYLFGPKKGKPGWELRQRREKKEFEIQIKSKLSSFLAHPINDIQRLFAINPS